MGLAAGLRGMLIQMKGTLCRFSRGESAVRPVGLPELLLLLILTLLPHPGLVVPGARHLCHL
jgi:hypothetical protein